MSNHLKQSLARVAHAGKILSEQETGTAAGDYEKASYLKDFLYEVKEMLLHATDTAPDYTPDWQDNHPLKYLKQSIEALEEDGDLDEMLLKLQSNLGDE